MAKAKQRESLNGWQQIAANIGGSTMGKIRDASTHEGRRVQASPEELNCWLGREVSSLSKSLPNPLISLQS